MLMPHRRKANRFQENMFDEYDVIGSICRESFAEFTKEFWSEISPEPLVWNWHMQLLCDELQHMAELVFRKEKKDYDLIVNIPPGTSKSSIASVLFPAWTWTRMSTARSICGSYTHSLAMDLSRKSRDVVSSEKYQLSFTEVQKLRDDQNTKSYFMNGNGGYRYAVGVGGSVTGMHGHFLIVDDPLDPQQAISEAELKSANTWMAETLPSRKVDKLVTPLILIMQRLHQNDPSGARLVNIRAGRVKHICLPAEDGENVKPPELREKYVDGLLDPIRLPLEVLREARAQLGNFGYAGQFDQNPIPLGGGMFKTVRLEMDVEPADPTFFVQTVRYWDKAATPGGGCYTVGVKMSVDKTGRYWVRHIVRGQWDSRERENIILQTARLDGKKVRVGIEQEPGGAGKESAESTAKNLAGFSVVLDKVDASDGSKALRADPFSVQVNAHNVTLVQAEWNWAYIEEMRFFPNSTYKDQVDASSGAFKMLTKRRIVCGAFGSRSAVS
jgi:predicted phage terminase large subunit-like protein